MKQTPNGHRRSFELVLVLVLWLLSAGRADAQRFRLPGPAAIEFQILEVAGEAEIWQARTRQVGMLTTEIVLAAGDQIRTGADGYVRIGLSDGSQMEIFAGAIVQLGEPRPSRLRLLDILIGQVRVMIQRLGGRPAAYNFATPTAVLAIRGTVFDVAVDETTATLVAVSEGAVFVENARYPGQGGVLVRQDYRTIVRPDELPAPPERFTGTGISFKAMETKHGRHMDPSPGGMMGQTDGTTGRPGDDTGGRGMPGGNSGTMHGGDPATGGSHMGGSHMGGGGMGGSPDSGRKKEGMH